jgi:predicted negative regulator of RcsB-dependent stress response
MKDNLKLTLVSLIVGLTFIFGAYSAHAAVNTEAQNAAAVIDALVDTLDKTASGAAKTRIVERFTNTEGDGSLTSEEKAAMFNDTLVQIIRSTVRSHAEQAEAATHAGDVTAAGDTAEADL